MMLNSSVSYSLISGAVVAVALVGCTDYGVSPIDPPEAPSVSISPEAPITTDRLHAIVGGDPGAQGVRLTYSWFRDGQAMPDLVTDAAPATLTRKGELWQVVVTPWSGSLEGASGRAQVEIRNSPPTVALSLVDPTPTTFADLAVTAVTADADLDEVTLTWAWQRDGAPTAISGPVVPASETRRGQLWRATVTPHDGDEAGDPAVLDVEIRNSAPSLDLVVLSPDPARTAMTLRAEPRGAQDLDGDPVGLTFAWYADGALVQSGADPSLAPSLFSKHQRVWVDVTPSDGLDDGATVRSNELTIENTPPSATGAEIRPAEVYTTTTVTCVGLGFADDDADPEGFEYRWTVNGAEVGSGPSLASSAFRKGDRIGCVATPTDGEALGAPVSAAVVTVRNTPPTIASVSLSPSSPKVADTITVAVGGASDADGDAVGFRYAWTVNSGAIGHTGSTLTSAFFKRGDRVAVTVTPNDGTDDGAPLTSAAVTVANTAPVVTGLTLAPRPAYTNTALTATPAASDADGDTLAYTYGWYVDGAKQSTTSGTLASSAFVKGKSVYAEVVASDGTESSAAFVSSSITISNSAPTTPGRPTLTPTSPLDTENLICTRGTASTDPDGDAITYEAQFRSGSTTHTIAVSGTIATLSSASTTAGQTWTCRIRANDDDGGESSWSTDSASVTVRSAWAGQRRFTNCGQTGTTGPSSSQCSSSYTSTTLAGEVSVTEGVQEWTAPTTGTYRIWACGAAGMSAESGRSGGRGACVRGDFGLTAGDRLFVAVGQNGTEDSGSGGGNGGGGGGTWVIRDSGYTRWSRSNELLLVAGGGGGTRMSVSQNGCDGRTTLDAGTGSASSSTHGCGALGSTYRGQGGPTPSSSWGSSGGGWTSDGAGDSSWGTGGRGFSNKLLGSAASDCGSSVGGFGGGGTGNGCWGGGGGGGYGGGQGGMLAGGGGSYNGGSTTSTSTNGTGAHGYVTIDLL
jgi:hypothetical protein